MPKMVDVMLSSEDVSRLAVFFAERGQSLDNGTAWLIEEGADTSAMIKAPGSS
jgi:hypothetical protein